MTTGEHTKRAEDLPCEESYHLKPLEGLRVLDAAGEDGLLCVQLLADLGAAVARASLHVDSDAERRTFTALARDADILVETFPPGYLADRRVDFDDLRRANIRLIHVSITPFGRTGPRSRCRSCDIVASAFGGQMYVTGGPSGPPVPPAGQQASRSASLFAAVAVLAALKRRDVTGGGEHLDISLQEAAAATLDHVMSRYFQEKVVPGRHGSRSWNRFFFILPCRDGLMQMSKTGWENLVEMVAAEEPLAGSGGGSRQQHPCNPPDVDRQTERVERWAMGRTRAQLFEVGQSMGFPWAPVATAEEVLASDQLAARCFFTTANGAPAARAPYLFTVLDDDTQPLHGGRPSASRVPAEVRGGRHRLMGADGPARPGRVAAVPLRGVRVLDFTRMLAGPYATRLLADCGAEVIKVQSGKTAKGVEENGSPYFTAWNRNKRSITLDMSRPEAREIALRLVAVSDVVVENFSPRVMENWALGYDALGRVNPALVMARISAFGHTGPWRDRTGFAPTFHALSGLTFMTSVGQPCPVLPGYGYADIVTGLYTVIAVLGALKQRERTGRGCCVDVSAYEAACAVMAPALFRSLSARPEEREAPGRPEAVRAAPYGCFRCSGDDRWTVIAVFGDGEWRKFCEVTGERRLARDPRFSTAGARRRHDRELCEAVERWTTTRTAEGVVQMLQDAGIASGVVQNAEDLAKDPQLLAREFFVRLDHPVLGVTVSDRSALPFFTDPGRDWLPAPALGEANDDVFRGLLGLTGAEIEGLQRAGAIG